MTNTYLWRVRDAEGKPHSIFLVIGGETMALYFEGLLMSERTGDSPMIRKLERVDPNAGIPYAVDLGVWDTAFTAEQVKATHQELCTEDHEGNLRPFPQKTIKAEPILERSPAMGTDDDVFFLRTLGDLRQKIHSHNDYEILKASGLIRLLLFDGTPLMDRVNRLYRLRLRFTVNDTSDHPFTLAQRDSGAKFMLDGDGLYAPSAPLKGVTRELNIDGFRGFSVGEVNGQGISVATLISYVANVMGGVHAGTVRESDDEIMKALSQQMDVRINGIRMIVLPIRAIGQIISDGLQPLCDAMRP